MAKVMQYMETQADFLFLMYVGPSYSNPLHLKLFLSCTQNNLSTSVIIKPATFLLTNELCGQNYLPVREWALRSALSWSLALDKESLLFSECWKCSFSFALASRAFMLSCNWLVYFSCCTHTQTGGKQDVKNLPPTISTAVTVLTYTHCKEEYPPETQASTSKYYTCIIFILIEFIYSNQHH